MDCAALKGKSDVMLGRVMYYDLTLKILRVGRMSIPQMHHISKT